MSMTTTAPIGSTVQFRVRATDGADSTSLWSYGPAVHLTAVQETSLAVRDLVVGTSLRERRARRIRGPDKRLGRVRSIHVYRPFDRLGPHNLVLDIKQAPAPPPGQKKVFVPIAPLYKVEHIFARLGRWRRLSRCYEGSAASARAWLEVASVSFLFARLRVVPT
jgi:hypothetical protein